MTDVWAGEEGGNVKEKQLAWKTNDTALSESLQQTGCVIEKEASVKVEGNWLLERGWQGKEAFSILYSTKFSQRRENTAEFHWGKAEDECGCSPASIHKGVKTTPAVNRLLYV